MVEIVAAKEGVEDDWGTALNRAEGCSKMRDPTCEGEGDALGSGPNWGSLQWGYEVVDVPSSVGVVAAEAGVAVAADGRFHVDLPHNRHHSSTLNCRPDSKVGPG